MNWLKTIQKTFVAAFFVVALGSLLFSAALGDGPAGQGSQAFPSLMPPRPGLLEELQKEGQPLPPFITDPDFFKARGINQGPKKLMKPAEEVKRARPSLPLSPEGQWGEKSGLPAPDRAPRLAPAPKIQPSGNVNAIALLVEFTDNSSSVAPSFFDQLIFGSSGSSVRVYYQEVSYGTLTIVTVDLPSSTGWYTAPQTYAYYANGNYGWGAYPQNAQRLTEDVVNLADPYVDFSQYDNDSDGFVDALFVIHAGPGAEFTGNPNDIWSHQWSTVNPPLVDGVSVTTYSMEPEYWASSGDMTIGVYCHELGHVFGLPDLYDYDGDSAGVGDWSIMAYGSWNGTWPGGDSPAHFDAWCRAELGFVTPVAITVNTPGVVVNSVEVTSTNSVYYVWNNGAANNEYFLVENRQQVGYDAYLSGNGLLIWHVDENMGGNNNQCTDHQNCNCPLHFLVALEQADGNLNLEWYNNSGDAGDPYPGTTNNRTFNLGSTPNSGSYADCTSKVEVFNISNSGSTMTADINVSLPYNVMLSPASQYGYGAPGATVTYTEQVRNDGSNTDSYNLTVSGNTWPTTIWDADFSTQISNTGNIASGGSITIGLSVDIPGGASAGDSDTATLQATSVVSPTVSDTAVLTTSVPNPILLVDDDVAAIPFADVESYYQDALTANGYAYDYWDTDVSGSPNLAVLQVHDIVIWFTGVDWLTTLSSSDESNLSAYLDGGGRLFFSSQDYLRDAGLTSFGQNYLHIGSYINNMGIVHTQVTGANVFAGYGPYNLSYPVPFLNFSDVFNDGFSQDAFTGNVTGNPAALTYDGGLFKTVFFAYPFEALQSADANAVMGRIITWLYGIEAEEKKIYLPIIVKTYAP